MLQLERPTLILPVSGTTLPERLSRMGVSLAQNLDRWYDRHLGIAAVNSMYTQRMISKLKYQILDLSNTNTERVTFRSVYLPFHEPTHTLCDPHALLPLCICYLLIQCSLECKVVQVQ